MKKALIIGANGYIGRHIAYFLKQSNVDFIPSGNNLISIDGYDNYVQVDITDVNSLQQLDFEVDYVFMFAAITGTRNDEEAKKQYTLVNEQGLKNVLDCCKEHKPCIIFPSSRLVYKGQKDVFLKENAENEAKTIYAQNKINGEQLLKDYQKDYGIDYTVFRICVPYGNLIDDNYSYGTLGFFLGRALKGEDITLYGIGEQRRTFTHVADIVGEMLSAMKHGESKNNTYNIGSNDALSLFQVANLVADKYNVGVSHIDWPEEALKIESGDTIFDDGKIIELTNYQYKYNIADWIESL